jgi:5-methylcytosine-specific restriction protein A
MPSLRPCLVCGTLNRGVSRCPGSDHDYGWPRASATSRGYGSAWAPLRKQVLIEERACRICGSTKALEVDHILNRARGGTEDRSNLQALCKACHSLKTHREGSVGRKGGAVPNLVVAPIERERAGGSVW